MAPDLRQAIERFLAMGGGSFLLLLDMVDGVQPPETPVVASSKTPERRSPTLAPTEAGPDKDGS